MSNPPDSEVSLKEVEDNDNELELTGEYLSENAPQCFLDEDGNMRKFKSTKSLPSDGSSWNLWFYEWSQWIYLSLMYPFGSGDTKKNDEDKSKEEEEI